MHNHAANRVCDRCGTCCTKGGPALHQEDMPLLQNRLLRPGQLITIRKGEPVMPLAGESPEPAASEMVKIKGRDGDWACIFLKKNGAACMIYEHRPLECSLLKCWDTADLENIIGRRLLCRHDIIGPHDPALAFIRQLDDTCSLQELLPILAELHHKETQQEALVKLTGMVNRDLALRSQAVARLRCSLDLELFFFGRPLFTILEQFGIKTFERYGSCSLSLAAKALSGHESPLKRQVEPPGVKWSGNG